MTTTIDLENYYPGYNDKDYSIEKDVNTTYSGTTKVYFRDTGLYLYSSTDGQLDIVADTTLALSGAVTVDSTITQTYSSSSTGAVAMQTNTCTMTGAGATGGRAIFTLNANAALGGWANAIKGNTTFNASGSVTGLGSVFCGDLTLSTGTSGGTYAVFEGNIIAGSSASTGTNTGFFALNADGADEDTIDSNGFLIVGGDALDAASGKFFDTDITTHSAYGGIRIYIEGVGTKYIALVSD